MKTYHVSAQQVIKYEIRVNIPDGMTIEEYLSTHTIDYDTYEGGYPEIKDWGTPEYTEIKELEGWAKCMA